MQIGKMRRRKGGRCKMKANGKKKKRIEKGGRHNPDPVGLKGK